MNERGDDNERIEWVIAAATQLRAPADPHRDLWPHILARISRDHVDQRARTARIWIALFAIVLLAAAGWVINARVHAYQAAHVSPVLSQIEITERLDRAESISSDHDKARVLASVIPDAKSDSALVLRVIKATRSIASSSDKVFVLRALAQSGAITASVRAAYLDAVGTVSSTDARQRLLNSLPRER